MYELNRKGEKYGALTVIRKDRDTSETYWWIFRCKCGEFRSVEEQRLIKGLVATCLKCEVKNKMAKMEKSNL